MPKALEVTIDGKKVGTYVPPTGKSFAAYLANIPKKYMRAHIVSGSDTENWYWQLPDMKEGQTISFRLIETNETGVPPRVEEKNLEEVAEFLRSQDEKFPRGSREYTKKQPTG